MLVILLVALTLSCLPALGQAASARFEFPADAFAYANQLSCRYELDPERNRMIEHQIQPRPPYTLRCFVVARSARQFFDHARFEPNEPKATHAIYRHLVRTVIRRTPRTVSADHRRIVIPGFANLREFSREYEALLKSECGGPRQSFLQRGNWRMVFPFTGRHQAKTAERLIRSLERGRPPLVHLVCFPELTLNHALLLMDWEPGEGGIRFIAYDPNDSDRPIQLEYSRDERAFVLGRTAYFAGGSVDVYEVYCGLLY